MAKPRTDTAASREMTVWKLKAISGISLVSCLSVAGAASPVIGRCFWKHPFSFPPLAGENVAGWGRDEPDNNTW